MPTFKLYYFQMYVLNNLKLFHFDDSIYDGTIVNLFIFDMIIYIFDQIARSKPFSSNAIVYRCFQMLYTIIWISRNFKTNNPPKANAPLPVFFRY